MFLGTLLAWPKCKDKLLASLKKKGVNFKEKNLNFRKAIGTGLLAREASTYLSMVSFLKKNPWNSRKHWLKQSSKHPIIVWADGSWLLFEQLSNILAKFTFWYFYIFFVSVIPNKQGTSTPSSSPRLPSLKKIIMLNSPELSARMKENFGFANLPLLLRGKWSS